MRQVKVQDVIDSLLEQNKQLTLQISLLQAALLEYEGDSEVDADASQKDTDSTVIE